MATVLEIKMLCVQIVSFQECYALNVINLSVRTELPSVKLNCAVSVSTPKSRLFN
jgi:hypothetical protein